MANLSAYHWRVRFVALCLLLILFCLVGHLLADVMGFSLDAFMPLDLRGNFVQAMPLYLCLVFVTTAILLLLHLWPIHWSKPPTTSPRVLPFFLSR